MRGKVAAVASVLWLPLLLAAATEAPAQTRYVAFGDSITAGVGDSSSRVEPGYPPRLEALLAGASVNAVVENQGLGGERTAEGVTRIDEVLEGGGDVLLLMEGTNDIHFGISIETTLFNLGEMASKAEARGVSVVHATLIPRLPGATVDSDNVLNQRLAESLRDLAGTSGRGLVDPFEIFGAIPGVFDDLYWQEPLDEVGHPNAGGYDLMAQIFFNALTGRDTVPPVTGVMSPATGSMEVDPDTAIEVDVWDFGAGIDVAATSLVINGETVAAQRSGDPQRVELSYQPPAPLQGSVRVGLRARDLATPPNTVDREVAHFIVAGSDLVRGDLDEDGRVDGADLVRFARSFGTRRGEPAYSTAADLNGDRIVDGMDLAILASNFGRVSF